MYTILIYAPPLSPLTLLVPHPNTCSSRLHALSYCFFNSQTESNKQLPSNHTLEANFSSSPLCQELFGLEVEPHKPLPHSSWDYWSVWTCTGNHGHREFMSTTAMSCPGDSMSQRSSPLPSSYTEICLRDVYDSPKPLFVPLKRHNWTTFPVSVSPGVCKDTYQVGRVTQDLSHRWTTLTTSCSIFLLKDAGFSHSLHLCRFPVPHSADNWEEQCQAKQASGMTPRTLRGGSRGELPLLPLLMPLWW